MILCKKKNYRTCPQIVCDLHPVPMDTLLSAEELLEKHLGGGFAASPFAPRTLRHGSPRCAESGLAKGVCFKSGKFDLMVFNGN